MGDLVARIEPDGTVDARQLAAGLGVLASSLDLADFGEEVVVKVMTNVPDESESERLDPVTVVETLGSISLVIKGLTLNVDQARKLLDALAGLLRSARGVKDAYLEVLGRPVTLPSVRPDDVVAETSE